MTTDETRRRLGELWCRLAVDLGLPEIEHPDEQELVESFAQSAAPLFTADAIAEAERRGKLEGLREARERFQSAIDGEGFSMPDEREGLYQAIDICDELIGATGSDPTPTPDPIPERHSLECPHCGDVAIWADADDCYQDGDGGKCISCGYPGAVSCDEETAPWWNEYQEAGYHCNRVDCEECRDEIAKLFAATDPIPDVDAVWEAIRETLGAISAGGVCCVSHRGLKAIGIGPTLGTNQAQAERALKGVLALELMSPSDEILAFARKVTQ